MYYTEDLMKVAPFSRLAKVYNPSDWPLGDKANVYAYGEISCLVIRWCVNAHCVYQQPCKSLSQPVGIKRNH